MKDLFGNECAFQDIKDIKGRKGTNDKAKAMHKQLTALYGTVNNKCKNCVHFGAKKYANTYFKCLIATPNWQGHTSTDWRANWTACGKFQKYDDNTDN